MTAFLYISYRSGLSKAYKLAREKLVFDNPLAVRKFLKKVHGKNYFIALILFFF
jgi:hypothetical protein